MSEPRLEHLLRWYPPAWRARYGNELLSLMEDTFGEDEPSPRRRLDIARAGLLERFREYGLGARASGPGDRVRSGSLLVLWAWALFVVAGAGFAKFAEHWDAVTPRADQRLPADAYNTVQWAAVIAVVVVGLAAAVALPSLVRFLRDGGWASIRRPVWRAVSVASATLALGAGVVIWAHHLSVGQRNGGSAPYSLVALLGAVMSVATIAICTSAVAAVANRVGISGRALRLEGWLALILTSAMIPIIGGTVLWWASVATRAPQFLSGAPAAMVLAGLLMVAGLVLATFGATRVARSIVARS
jgi:hypothetical protein